MDKRNEYRVVNNARYASWFAAEFRSPRPFWFGFTRWQEIQTCESMELAEACCRRHAGEGSKYLGRLP